ncbi:MAG: prepilin-type N-terminal cleavage/methylation domain-containing protein [Spartobacteria bacterium]|nr:prepilin-type N-terminal cleavage/methylation domain-containing protein [Spartobacteria bacterium]
MRRGFTLTEMVIVTAIIALITAIGIPSYRYAAERYEMQRFASDLRLFVQAFELYKLDNGAYPPDGTPSSSVPGMAAIFQAEKLDSAGLNWAADRPLGGQWDWDYNQFGGLTGVSVYKPQLSTAKMAIIDRIIDDGNLVTGQFRSRNNGYIYVIEE